MRVIFGVLRASVAVAQLLSLVLLGTVAHARAVPTPVGHCPLHEPNCRPSHPPIPPTRVSTEYAKQYALRHFGADVAAHMLYRVEDPYGTSSNATTVASLQGPIAPAASPIPLGGGGGPIYNTYYSGVWGGYYSDVSGTAYRVTDAHGWFNVANQTSGDRSLATWVGVGGVNGTGNLAQTGVDLLGPRPWYQLYPSPVVYLDTCCGFVVQISDTMFADVSYDTATLKWAIFLENYTRGYYYMNEFAFNPDQTTADWIVEDPNAYIPLPFVTTTNFTTSYWEDNYSSTTRAIDDSEVRVVWRSLLRPPGSTRCIVPNGLTSGTGSSSFSVAGASSC